MPVYTDTFIDELIRCEKIITSEYRYNLTANRGYLRDGCRLTSIDGEHSFQAFMRQNNVFRENFSVGLVYLPEEGSTIEICRCNGPHGPHAMWEHHDHCHIHKATESNILEGFREDSFIEITAEYRTYEEAVRFFLNYVNVNEECLRRSFPNINQLTLL